MTAPGWALPTLPDDTCGCCEGVQPLTPVPHENRPGLPALAYRIGTHGSFRETMQAALSRQPALAELQTRAEDDPTLALIDAWATVADVLTFYQERIANEGYLRTATERRSVLELARAIGYELRPGVSAAALLSVQMQQAAGRAATAVTAPPTAVMPRGTQVRSVPGQGQLPQTFETSADLVPDRARNELHLV